MTMVRRLVSIMFFLPSSALLAQEGADSVFAVKKDAAWEIKYKAKAHETSRMLAKRFYVSEGQMEMSNDEATMRKLEEGKTVYIPVTKDNYYTTRPAPLKMKNATELYYRVGRRDDIALIANYCGVTKNEVREWNQLKGYTLKPGSALFIGWVRMMARDTLNPGLSGAYYVPKKEKPVDTAAAPPALGGLDTVYNMQTNSGLNVLTEKGTAVFFEKPGKTVMYYAFHNEASRGSIIKVHNPGTGKAIYAKVLGPLPDTRQYANSIIGISAAAKQELGVVENRMWCELSYAAN